MADNNRSYRKKWMWGVFHCYYSVAELQKKISYYIFLPWT
jgi:hypothetical protein